MLNITHYQRNANQNHNEVTFHASQMSAIQKSIGNKCWRGCGEKGTLLHCWWECKLVQPLWRRVWRFLKKLEIELPSVRFSHSVVSNSLQPHESQHVRPPCPSPTPGVHSDSCPSIPTLNQHLSSPRSLNQDRIKRSYIILLKSHRQRSSTIYYSLAMETIQGPINR